MRKETKTIFIADDGKEFDSESECIKYEVTEQLAERFNQDVYTSDIDGRDVAKWLIENRMFIYAKLADPRID